MVRGIGMGMGPMLPRKRVRFRTASSFGQDSFPPPAKIHY